MCIRMSPLEIDINVNNVLASMEIPICLSCGYADIDNHSCRGRPNYYTDEEWKSLLNTRYRVAERQYQHHIEEMKIEQEKRKRDLDIDKEIKDLESLRKIFLRNSNPLESLANEATERWKSSLRENLDIRNKIKDEIQDRFDDLDYDMEYMEEIIENSLESNLSHTNREELLKVVQDVFDVFTNNHNRIIEIIGNFSSQRELELPKNCACETNPTQHCRVHPARDYRKDFTGSDGTLGMYDNDD